MESSAPEPLPTERRKSLQLVLGKIKTVLKRGSSSRTSVSGPSGAVADMNTANKENEPPTAPPTQDMTENADAPAQPLASSPTEYPTNQGIIEPEAMAPRDRASVLFAKYNLDSAQLPWPAPREHPERIHKPIRMRVRYTCHRCKTSFGHDRECNSCQHRRCTRCERYPPKKTREPRTEKTVAAHVMATDGTSAQPLPPNDGMEEKVCLCHECQTDVLVGLGHCPNCDHAICERCHQEAIALDEPRPISQTSVESSQPIGTTVTAPTERTEPSAGMP